MSLTHKQNVCIAYSCARPCVFTMSQLLMLERLNSLNISPAFSEEPSSFQWNDPRSIFLALWMCVVCENTGKANTEVTDSTEGQRKAQTTCL